MTERPRIEGLHLHLTIRDRSDPVDRRPSASGDRGLERCARASIELFLISFFILFFELACIRWFGSTVIFLTFFTNIVLMACFLGVSVGCLAARGGGRG